MSQVSEFTLPQTQQTWKQKCIKLQNQLLQARIQEINIKRINRSLEDTLKLAISEDLPQTYRNSTQRMNFTWKQKYQLEVQKNLQNQKYIKVLQTKRNTLSSNKTNKKRQQSTNTRVSFKTETRTRYTPTPLTTIGLHENMNTRPMARNSSVNKMEGFMERLMKEKYSISDFGFDNYTQNYPIEVPKVKQFYCAQKDPIEKLFGSVRGISAKQNYSRETEQQELPLKVRNSLNQNSIPNRSINSKLVENTLNKKLTLASHLR